jgi:hypothetical protein
MGGRKEWTGDRSYEIHDVNTLPRHFVATFNPGDTLYLFVSDASASMSELAKSRESAQAAFPNNPVKIIAGIQGVLVERGSNDGNDSAGAANLSGESS